MLSLLVQCCVSERWEACMNGSVSRSVWGGTPAKLGGFSQKTAFVRSTQQHPLPRGVRRAVSSTRCTESPRGEVCKASPAGRRVSWKCPRHCPQTRCPCPLPSATAQTMAEEAAWAAFPFWSLENRGSTQAGDGFSSWMRMKRLRADCSFLRAQPLVTGVELRTREQSSAVSAADRAQCGETKSGAVFAAFLVAFTSAQSRLPLFRSLLTCRSLSSAAPQPRAWIRLPLQIKPAKCIEHKEPELCVRFEALSSLVVVPGAQICLRAAAGLPTNTPGSGKAARPGPAALSHSPLGTVCKLLLGFGRAAAGHSGQQAAELRACTELSVPCRALHCRPS